VTRSSVRVKPHDAVAQPTTCQPYTDTELVRLKQRLHAGTRVNRTHALRLLATIEQDRERSVTAPDVRPQAQRQGGMRIQVDATQRILTPIQLRVLSELCRGRRTREIARLLGRSTPTVYSHVRLLCIAFGVHTRAALIAQAIRQNIVSFEASPPSRGRGSSSD
jgi:DNA-binding NarL/FixJ family response regulator